MWSDVVAAWVLAKSIVPCCTQFCVCSKTLKSGLAVGEGRLGGCTLQGSTALNAGNATALSWIPL